MTSQCRHFWFSEILHMKFGFPEILLKENYPSNNKYSSPTNLHITPDYFLKYKKAPFPEI